MPRQERLAPLPFDEQEAFIIAQRDIWERVGTFCYPALPKTLGDTIDFQVWADIPRIKVDPVSGNPTGAQYLRFKELAHAVVRLSNGQIESSVSWRVARQSIRERLDAVETSVEKALLRSAASKFSELSFAEHMHTPIIDILSGLILDGRIKIADWQRYSGEDETQSRFLDYVAMLAAADLVKTEGDLIRPGNVLVGIQDQAGDPVEVLRGSMSHFFEDGVERIESIRKVVGPHLRIASRVYENALEWGEQAGLTPEYLEGYMHDRYPREPRRPLQVARYLIQLVRIHILRFREADGATTVIPEPDILTGVSTSAGLLAPFRSALVRPAAPA